MPPMMKNSNRIEPQKAIALNGIQKGE